jgi:hypothetical protein
MKKIVVLIVFAISFVYAQISATIESQKYKAGNGYSFYPGSVKINDSELAIGSFITDLDGNIKSSIPSYLEKGFAFSKNGVYVSYETKIVVTNAYAFVDYLSLNTITALGKAKKLDIKRTSSNTYLSTEKCFETPYVFPQFMSAEGGLSDYCLFVVYNNLQVVENDNITKSLEIKAKGRKMDQLYTSEGIYYALFADDKKLTLARIDLKTGTDKYITVDNKQEYYAGGNIEISGDNLIIGTFYGECDSKGYSTADGFMSATIKQTDLSIVNQSTSPIPSEYEDKLDFCGNKLRLPEVLDIQQSGSSTYFLTNNFSGEFGPLAIWSYKNGALDFNSNVTAESKAYIRSAKLFDYNNKVYLLYTEDEGQYPQKVTESIKLAEIDGSDVTGIEVKIETSAQVKGLFNLNYSYLTSNGLILVPSNNEYDTCYLLKIQL